MTIRFQSTVRTEFGTDYELRLAECSCWTDGTIPGIWKDKNSNTELKIEAITIFVNNKNKL